ncbi:DUF5919 domain-containing protein [Pseudonocardia abyssalis]|uniref:DUF5919 domain-containing protein n=1 Tax=Pseudonocardia abyssalis TaxID=2792008 RepID=A0ABS6UKS7_9PSEU|nr:DUF5919 domain-containing protein [Pseudonocardia abyssalis]MBW0116500.1 hypothetical protein [Pseudonocardia abyssalis]MBW0132826.1 hypothetical protein [Pseudonocardia abyssalis]
MSETQTLLKAMLRQRHMQEHRTFCRAYDKTAKQIDNALVGRHPSKATFYRWLAGGGSKLPHPDHCRVLEAMFPGVKAGELLAPWDDRRPLPDTAHAEQAARLAGNGTDAPRRATYADLTAAFATRAEFAEQMPPHTLLDQASSIKAAGLSLNMLCQHYSDQRLRATLARGAIVHALFLDPDGDATRAREVEEGHGVGDLASLTRLNMQMLRRLRAELPADERERVTMRTYDEPVRFNITILDDRQCIAQPYMPAARGVDSPTFVIRRRPDGSGMFGSFERVFTALWEGGRDCA